MPEPLRFLLIDDDPDDRALIQHELGRQFPDALFEHANDGADLDRLLAGGPFDVVLTDYQLGWSDGLAVLRTLRAQRPDQPVIMVTGTGSETIAVEAMKSGLDDYVLKSPPHFARLGASVRLALDRTRAQGALQEAEGRYRSLFEGLPIGLARVRPDGTFLDVNPAMAEIFGFPDRAALMAANVRDLHASAEEYPRLLAELERQGVVQAREMSMRRRDGSTVWILTSARAIHDGGDGVRLIECSAEDVTDRRRVEEALRLAQSAVTNASDAVMITEAEPLDLPGPRIVYVNEAFTRMTGYRLPETLGQTPRLLHGPKTDPGALAAAREAMLHREPARVEIVSYRKDGTEFWVESNIVPVLDARGRLTHFVSIARETTERKRTEQTLEKLAAYPRSNPHPVLEFSPEGVLTYHNRAAQSLAESLGKTSPTGILPPDTPAIIRQCLATGSERHNLERLTEGRTLTWSFIPVPASRTVIAYAFDISARVELETQLRQVQKLDAIGRLAGGIAHEFSNLLTVISGHGEILAQRLPEEDPARRNLHEISSASSRAAALTRQLLVFSRRQMLRPIVLDLNTVARDMQNLLRRLLGEDVELVAKLDPELGRVRADAGQIEQMIINLALNARDAMPTGGRLTLETMNVELDEAHVRAHAGTRPGRYAMLVVSDTGCGMDEETRARLFEPFFTTKPQGQRAGMGLAIVYGIVQQSGGSITVSSEQRRGSSFRVYLPLAEGAAAPRPEPAAEAARGTETILLVEDEPVVRDLCQEVLSRSGYTVLSARDSSEARRLCESHQGPIHLLLTDIVMPELSGHELACRLSPLRPDMRVLYMSGHSDEAVTAHGVSEPSVAFLQKPFTPDTLARKVRQGLDGA
jgi:PAS domain S-box-containing protein